MRKFFKKLLFMGTMAAAVMSFSFTAHAGDYLATDVSEPADGNFFIAVDGTFYTTGKDAILQQINLIRYKACRNGEPVSYGSSTKLSLDTDYGENPTADQLAETNGNYVPVKWSAELEKATEIRAAEGDINLDHTRANGGSCWDVTYNLFGKYYTSSECLAWNWYSSSTAMSYGIEQWEGERADYTGQTGNTYGHYYALINPSTRYVGLACFKYSEDANGTVPYGGWCALAMQTSSYSSGLTETARGIAGDKTQIVEIDGDFLDSIAVSGNTSLIVGNTDTAKVKATFTTTGIGSPTRTWEVYKGGEWTSDNTDVVTVDSSTGTVTAVGVGSANITVNVAGQTASYGVSVKKSITDTTVTLGAESYIYDGTAKTPEVTVKDGSTVLTKDTDYTVTYSNNVKSGEATVTVAGKGNYIGSVAKTFNIAGVTYRTHVQSYGWQDWVSDGESAGTTGKAKRLESINIKLAGTTGGIRYKTHVQKIGWQDWVADGEMAGTSGQSKRLEAIQIELTGDAAELYDVYYRVHAQHFGWLDWAKNGEIAGTAGYAYRLESIQIRLVEKGGEAPGETTTPYHVARVRYQTHVQSVGWQPLVGEGIMSGTEGKALRLEGIKINLANTDYESGIRYKTHVQKIGWQDWGADGEMSGTSGESKRLEAIQIELTGEMAEQYDIYYRVHAQRFGWLDWAKNGEVAGTTGYGYRLEAIEIVLLPKGTTDDSMSTETSCVIKEEPTQTQDETLDQVVDQTEDETGEQTVNQTEDETVDVTEDQAVDETVDVTVDQTVDETVDVIVD